MKPAPAAQGRAPVAAGPQGLAVPAPWGVAWWTALGSLLVMGLLDTAGLNLASVSHMPRGVSTVVAALCVFGPGLIAAYIGLWRSPRSRGLAAGRHRATQAQAGELGWSVFSLLLAVGLGLAVANGLTQLLARPLAGSLLSQAVEPVMALSALGAMALVWTGMRVAATAAARARLAGQVNADAVWDLRRFGALWAALALACAVGDGVWTASQADWAWAAFFDAALVASMFAWLSGIVGLGVFAAVRRHWRSVPARPAGSLWIVVSDPGDPERQRHHLAALSRLTERWTHGPVTWLLPRGVDLCGEHALLAQRLGLLAAISPTQSHQVLDLARQLPPPDRWRALVQREVHATPELLIATLEAYRQPEDAVVELCWKERDERWSFSLKEPRWAFFDVENLSRPGPQPHSLQDLDDLCVQLAPASDTGTLEPQPTPGSAGATVDADVGDDATAFTRVARDLLARIRQLGLRRSQPAAEPDRAEALRRLASALRARVAQLERQEAIESLKAVLRPSRVPSSDAQAESDLASASVASGVAPAAEPDESAVEQDQPPAEGAEPAGLPDLEAARTWQAKTLAARRRDLGDEHPETLEAMRDLAQTLKDQGDLAGGRALEEAVLDVARRVLGAEHPDTLKSMGRLANTLGFQGDLAGARELGAAALAGMRQVLGAEHPDALTAMHNLGMVLFEEGDHASARRLAEEALAISQRSWGDDDPITLKAVGALVDLLLLNGELEAARRLQESVLASAQRLLGEMHPDTLTAMNNLANTLTHMGERSRARALQEKVLFTRRQVLGDDHPDTRRALTDLARSLKGQSELSAARRLEEAALASYQRALGEAHPETLRMEIDVADTLHLQGERSAAEERYRHVWSVTEGLAHSDPDNVQWQRILSICAEALADLLDQGGRRQEAQEMARRALAIDERLAARDPNNRDWQRRVVRSRARSLDAGDRA